MQGIPPVKAFIRGHTLAVLFLPAAGISSATPMFAGLR